MTASERKKAQQNQQNALKKDWKKQNKKWRD
jgi:hypothetical protein